jgi:hypothetical protein
MDNKAMYSVIVSNIRFTMSKIKILVCLACCCFLFACNKNDKIAVMYGSGVEKFRLDYSRAYLTADIFEFKNGISEAKGFGEKYEFSLVEDRNYEFSGLILEAPYLVKRKVVEMEAIGPEVKGTYERVSNVSVIGKMPNDDKWYLVIVNF